VLHHEELEQQPGYEWVALSVITVGALLAALQGSSLIIALPGQFRGVTVHSIAVTDQS
jgi:hypothetical protein